jgi:hypothetical protein
MKWGIFILFTVMFLFLVPIPIKITLAYIDNHLCLYIYKFKIKLQKKENKKKTKRPKKTNRKFQFDLEDMKLLAHKIDCNRFKPTLRLNISLDYGLWDAYSTGISYGVINSLSPFIYNLLTIIFKVKKYDMELKPDFDELVLAAVIKSIIFINLAKITYMAVLILKSIKFTKHKNNYACENI